MPSVGDGWFLGHPGAFRIEELPPRAGASGDGYTRQAWTRDGTLCY